tara:strand:- start:627 stop:1265 length:639 start_codon:yes stop_codon:yes gene_type:complete
MSEQQKLSSFIKDEAKTYKKNQFNTTEGGSFYGHTAENNAKMAVMLRRIFPSPFKRGQWLGLQLGGELDGSILCSAPSSFQIRCGEAPINNEVAGVWYAENGDIVIGAPKGRIRIFAQSIDLISTGDGKETGWVNILANTEFNASAGEIKMESGGAFSVEADTMDVNTSGKNEYNVGSFKVIEGGDFLTVPGTGNITIEQHLTSLQKLVGVF